MSDRHELHKRLAQDWRDQIISAGGDRNVAEQAVTLAALNGLFDGYGDHAPTRNGVPLTVLKPQIERLRKNDFAGMETMRTFALNIIDDLMDSPSAARTDDPVAWRMRIGPESYDITQRASLADEWRDYGHDVEELGVLIRSTSVTAAVGCPSCGADSVMASCRACHGSPSPSTASTDEPVDDWQDDPSADERWNAGLDFGMVQLCAVLGVDPHMVNWDAATETLDGDVCAAIGNILRKKYGDDFDPTAAGLTVLAHQREAISDVAAERQRQISKEGWTPEHDDEHGTGEMATAAAFYALGPKHAHTIVTPVTPHWRAETILARLWPWDLEWWKPKSRRQDLVRAGALIVAEIERLDRAQSRHERETSQPITGEVGRNDASFF